MSTVEAAKDSAKEGTVETIPKPKGGLAKWLVLAIAIALIAIGVIVAVWTGVLSFPGQKSSGANVAALAARVVELEKAASTKAPDLSGDIARLEQQVAVLAEGDSGSEGVSADLEARLDETQKEIAALRTQVLQFEVTTQETNSLSPEALDEAQQELASVKQALQGLSARSEGLTRSLAQNDVRLDQLEENAPPEDLDVILSSLSAQSDVDALTERLMSLEKFNSIEAAAQATTALAAADLTRAARGSDPFVRQLDAFSMVSPGDPSARLLRSYAVAGVATRAALASQFYNVIRAAIEAEKRSKGTRWYSSLWASFTALFDVRKMGEIEGVSTKAVIARAEQRIGDGDLDAAANEMMGLQGAAAEAASPWLAQARARQQVDQLISTLNARVFSSLEATLKAASDGKTASDGVEGDR